MSSYTSSTASDPLRSRRAALPPDAPPSPAPGGASDGYSSPEQQVYPPQVQGKSSQRYVYEPPWSQEQPSKTRGFSAEKDPVAKFPWWTLKGWVRQSGPVGGKGRRKQTMWDHLGGGLYLSSGEIKMLFAVLVLACVVRLWRIGRPSSVVFDEVHFGGFASKYIQSRFFMDVHPPLAKLLITAAAYLSGFDGKFDFKEIAREYGPDHVPYVQMRLLTATLGIALVPITYLTLRGLACRPLTAILGSLLVTFDNALITQSRFILLDSPLIFFTALTIFLWVGFANENDRNGGGPGGVGQGSGPFTPKWWAWLCLCGTSLGAVASCKWVGLFTIATLGLATIRQLWELLGDLRVSVPLLVRHFVARAIGLILIPTLFYMSMFGLHFLILSNSGEGDGFMSSEFQQTLRGHGMEDTYADILLGSRISIRHYNTQGGYLHSHPHMYPTGSKQQQITLYPHKDENNDWHVLNYTMPEEPVPDYQTQTPPTIITNGMQIRLHHVMTSKKLHSHDVRPPVTEVDYQNEVSAYGFEGFEGDANDHFFIEFDQENTDRKDKAAMQRLRTLRTKFRLRHALTGCYLFSHKVKLPDWGFDQQEVTCNKNPSRPNTIWYAETNTHPLLPESAEKVNYRRPGFLSKFSELQAVMWRTNAGLTERHAYDSRPESWPVLRRGINFWVKDHRQIYLIGNPFIWWSGTLSVLLYLGVRALLIIRAQRGFNDFNASQVVFYDRMCGFTVLAWGLHYFPFFLMQRQLFLHHYLPALYFSILTFCVVFDFATSAIKPQIRVQIALVIFLLALLAFWHWNPLTYAGEWTKGKCESAKWLKTWDFSCNDFYDKYSDYTPESVGPTPTPDGNGAAVPIGDVVNVPDQEQTTSAMAGAVEPGRDVFQGPHQVKEIPKSGSNDPSPVVGRDGSQGDNHLNDFGDRLRAQINKGDQQRDEVEAPLVSSATPSAVDPNQQEGPKREGEIEESRERAQREGAQIPLQAAVPTGGQDGHAPNVVPDVNAGAGLHGGLKNEAVRAADDEGIRESEPTDLAKKNLRQQPPPQEPLGILPLGGQRGREKKVQGQAPLDPNEWKEVRQAAPAWDKDRYRGDLDDDEEDDEADFTYDDEDGVPIRQADNGRQAAGRGGAGLRQQDDELLREMRQARAAANVRKAEAQREAAAKYGGEGRLHIVDDDDASGQRARKPDPVAAIRQGEKEDVRKPLAPGAEGAEDEAQAEAIRKEMADLFND